LIITTLKFPKTQEQRALAIQTVTKEYNAIVAENRIRVALNHNAPKDHIHKVGEIVLVYQEESRTLEGPFILTKIHDNILYVYKETQNTKTRRLNITQVSPLVPPEYLEAH
jgi:hypothetical protein